MRWVGAVASALGVAGVLLAASCQSPTQITVAVVTDLPCSEVSDAQITVGNLGEIETKPITATMKCSGNGDFGTLVLVPSGGQTDQVAFKVVVARPGRDVTTCQAPAYGKGCIVARRALHYIEHSSLRVVVTMRASCDDVPCGEVQTCAAGVCKSAYIPRSSDCATPAGCGEEGLPSAPTSDGGAAEAGADGGVADADGGGPRVIAIAAGSTHTCALLSTGAVKCWGDNSQGALGTGATGAVEPRPVDVAQLGAVATAITAGDNVTCALLQGGRAKCWGRNVEGQIGDGTFDPRPLPTYVVVPDGGGSFTQISQSASGFACGVSAGQALCWGANAGFQLGDNSPDKHAPPTPIDDRNLRQTIRAVVTSSGRANPETASGERRGNTCAILDDFSLACWGANDQSQCARSPSSYLGLPEKIAALNGGVDEVSVGGQHACVRAAGVISCWGSEREGQVGNGYQPNQTDSPAAIDFGPGLRAQRVSVGDKHSCALLDNKSVRCWGDNSFRQVGDNDASTPVGDQTLVPLDQDATSISAAMNHTCAVLADGTVRCWGDNSQGQLGDGTQITPPMPVKVQNLP